jgi:hypothetical protein
LNTCCFVPCEKQTSACILKAVMAASNRSNHFSTPCIIFINFCDFSRHHLYLTCCTSLPEVCKKSVSNYFRARTNLITTTNSFHSYSARHVEVLEAFEQTCCFSSSCHSSVSWIKHSESPIQFRDPNRARPLPTVIVSSWSVLFYHSTRN